MTEAYYKKKSVFWHETGHFIAGFYNHQHYGTYGTESITLKRIELANGNFEYEGAREPAKPRDYDPNSKPPIKHPAALVAAVVYGCFIQCIYLNSPLRSCLNDERSGARGHNDYSKLFGIFHIFHLDVNVKQNVLELIESQFEQIVDNTEFKLLLSVNVDDLVESHEPIFKIDLKKLSSRIEDFLQKHELEYIAFVEKLEALFEPYCL